MNWSTFCIDLHKQKAKRLTAFKRQATGTNTCKKYIYGTKPKHAVDSWKSGTAKFATRVATGLRADRCDLIMGNKLLQALYLPQERSLVDISLSKPLILIPKEKSVCNDRMKMVTATQLYSESSAEGRSPEEQNALRWMGSISESSPEQHTAVQGNHQTS